MKVLKKILFILEALVLLILIVVSMVMLRINHKTKVISDDCSGFLTAPQYREAVAVENVNCVKQEVSCGYAVIEMFSEWAGEDVTETSLYEKYGKVVTSTGKSFEKEMNKQFPKYKTTMRKYLKNSELLAKAYDSLKQGVPVPFEWAAKLDGQWTLHYSLLVGMDVPNDIVTVLNPYGYEEKISIKEFLDRTSFEAYENMPFYYKLAFAFEIFEKNTIFIVEKR